MQIDISQSNFRSPDNWELFHASCGSTLDIILKPSQTTHFTANKTNTTVMLIHRSLHATSPPTRPPYRSAFPLRSSMRIKICKIPLRNVNLAIFYSKYAVKSVLKRKQSLPTAQKPPWGASYYPARSTFGTSNPALLL